MLTFWGFVKKPLWLIHQLMLNLSKPHLHKTEQSEGFLDRLEDHE